MIRKIGLFIFLLILFPIFVNAETSIEFVCDSEVMIGNEVVCSIALNTDKYIYGLSLDYEFSSEFSYTDTVLANNWQNVVSNSDGITIVNMDGLTGNIDIGNVTFLVSDNVEIGSEYYVKLNNIVLSDGDNDLKLDNKENSIRVLSLSEIVDSIVVENENLTIVDGVVNYTVVVDNNLNNVNIIVNLRNSGYEVVSDFDLGNFVLDSEDNYCVFSIYKKGVELIQYNINIKKEAFFYDEVVSNPGTGVVFSYILIGIILIVSIIFLLGIRRKIYFVKYNDEVKK